MNKQGLYTQFTEGQGMRTSLLYPAAVLLSAGLGLFLFPQFLVSLLGSHVYYSPEILRLSGMFMLVLGAFVSNTYGHALKILYPWTIYLRIFMGFCLGFLYLTSKNPLFLAILGILGIGLLLSFAGLYLDEKYSA